MARVDAGAALVLAVDGATGASAAFNAASLLARAAAERASGRRAAAIALAATNAGIATQAAWSQALFLAHRFGLPVEPFFSEGAWLAPRLLLLAGTVAVSALILRRAR